MASRNYTDPTLKKLFGLSGNQCACPNCEESMISEKKDVFGEICHINGLEPTSPRHDSSLSTAEMNDYENLVVLCPNHHTKADNDIETYNVEYLQKIKNEHEEKYKPKPYTVDAQTLEALQLHFNQNQTNVNKSDGTQLNTQSGNIANYTINNVIDLENLGQMIFENNYPRILSKATDVAKASAMEFVQTLVEKAKKELTDKDIPSLSDPDLQYMLTKTVITTGRNSDPNLRRNLVNLMIGRIKNNNTDFEKILYDEAIETLPKLTENQLKILSSSYVLRRIKFPNISTPEIFENTYKIIFNSLMNFKETETELEHIVYTRTGTLSIGEWNFKKILNANCPNLDVNYVLETGTGKKIIDFLKNSRIKNLVTTSVGGLIAIMYFEEFTKLKINFDSSRI